MTQKTAAMLAQLKSREYTHHRRHVAAEAYICEDTPKNFLDVFQTALSFERPFLYENDFFGFHLSTDHVHRFFGGFGGNLTPDYGRALRLGLDKIRQEIVDSMEKSKNASALSYGQQMLSAIDLVVSQCEKHRTFAHESGNYALAEALEHIPRAGATGFYEACVFLNLILYFLRISNVGQLTLGRFDQYMYPFYQQDRKRGVPDAQIFEWLEAFFIALNLDTDLYPGIQRGDNGQSMVLGGYDSDGNSCYNELTQMCLEASTNLCLIDPKINLRVNRGTPDSVYRLGTELTKKGLGFPQYCNDDVIVPGLEMLGYTRCDAFDYSVAACWEPIIPGKGADLPNLSVLAFPDVVHRVICEKLAYCETFAQLLSAVDREIAAQCDRIIAHFYARHPDEPNAFNPLLSVFMDGCTQTLKDTYWGGVAYNNYGCHGLGIANAADALAAVKKTIFDKKLLTAEQLISALKDNFEHYPQIRNLLISCPKMGNNDNYVDEIARVLIDSFSCHLNGKPNGFGGVWRAGTGSANLYLDAIHSATADGRIASTPYSCSFSPSLNVKTDGVLSVIQSFTKQDLRGAINGGPLTLELHDSVFRNDIGTEKVAQLVKSFIRLGGHQLQLNAVNRERLLDAQKHPQDYPNLIVRVWGWSGYFNELEKPFQDHIIRRTEYGE